MKTLTASQHNANEGSTVGSFTFRVDVTKPKKIKKAKESK